MNDLYDCEVYKRADVFLLRGGADKSLARPTSRCRRTESIVSLERGVFSCAELHVFFCYRGWKEACQATRGFSTKSRRELPSSFFFLQGKAPKETHAILTEILSTGSSLLSHEYSRKEPLPRPRNQLPSPDRQAYKTDPHDTTDVHTHTSTWTLISTNDKLLQS